MIGALYLSSANPAREASTGETGLYRAVKWLDDIKCAPLKTSGILDIIRQAKTSSLNLKMPLYIFDFGETDSIQDVFNKYFDNMSGYE